MKREKAENGIDERLTNHFRVNTKLFWREVSVSRGCSLTCSIKGVLSKHGEILTEFYKEMYECNDASVSSRSETLSLDVADGEISVKEVESAIRSLKCAFERSRKKHENLSEDMYKEVDDSGKRYVENVAFGAPFSLTTPLEIKREASHTSTDKSH